MDINKYRPAYVVEREDVDGMNKTWYSSVHSVSGDYSRPGQQFPPRAAP